MSLDSVRARFERRQADLFRSEAIVTRPGSGATINTSSGVMTPSSPSVVYEGDCLIRGFKWEGTDVTAGGTEDRFRRYQVKFPKDATIQIDDQIKPTSSTFDSSLVGRTMRVTDVARDAWQISRWVIAEETSRE